MLGAAVWAEMQDGTNPRVPTEDEFCRSGQQTEPGGVPAGTQQPVMLFLDTNNRLFIGTGGLHYDKAKKYIYMDVQEPVCTYRSVPQSQVKTKQQGMTGAQKPCAPPNKAGLQAASASSLITFQLHQHPFTHSTGLQHAREHPPSRSKS